MVATLVWDDGEVGSVDERNHQRGDGVATVVFGVGEDDEVGFEEFGFWWV